VAILGGWGAAQASLWAFGLSDVWHFLALDASAVRGGEYWRIITHQVFHANLPHFLLTVGAVFFAGREVEPIIGRKSFVGLCVAAGILGAIADMLLFPRVVVSGFSASAAAIVAAYATILPELEHRFSLIIPRPLRFRAKHGALVLLLACAGLLAFRVLLEIGPGGILLGAAVGWGWARRLGFGNAFWFQRRRMEERQQALRRLRMNAEEFVAQEIDPILEKISREGVGSLTRAERKILEEGRGKLAQKRSSAKV
jgi:membrane associated rhomboid family serine protease